MQGGREYEKRKNHPIVRAFKPLNEFVEKILVHERARKGNIETTQEVEIYFNFVGRYVPPHFGEVNLTPEEQEALRKKEERKNRLHQNYLRRKVNGKQREYEDRIKTEKRRQMEAKKAALRAKDMANGVYALTSSLPGKETQKGILSARSAVIRVKMCRNTNTTYNCVIVGSCNTTILIK